MRTLQNYIGDAAKFECDYKNAAEVLSDVNKLQTLHGMMGLVTESGELLENFKKHVFYGKSFDFINNIEELGDLMWYFALLCRALKIKHPELEILERNLIKLATRYGSKFTKEAAINRDLVKERKALGG